MGAREVRGFHALGLLKKIHLRKSTSGIPFWVFLFEEPPQKHNWGHLQKQNRRSFWGHMTEAYKQVNSPAENSQKIFNRNLTREFEQKIHPLDTRLENARLAYKIQSLIQAKVFAKWQKARPRHDWTDIKNFGTPFIFKDKLGDTSERGIGVGLPQLCSTTTWQG